MLDDTDGPEAAAVGQKRWLEGHAPWGTQGDHHQYEEYSLPSAAKKLRTAPVLCKHGRRKSRCKDCGGSGLCEHKRERSRCKDFVGSGLCEHKRERRRFRDCGGSGLCEHQRQASVMTHTRTAPEASKSVFMVVSLDSVCGVPRQIRNYA
jgi:hypothetical protein